MKAGGVPSFLMEMQTKATRRICTIARDEQDWTALRPRMQAVADSLSAELMAVDPAMASAAKQSMDSSLEMAESPWFRYLLTLNPAEILRKVTVPVLAINGSLDLQVAAKENLAAIEKALHEGGNHDVTAQELPGLNHLFQTATTGLPAEYATIEETMSPVAMKTVSDWILLKVKAKK
jgi:hypothetical protein